MKKFLIYILFVIMGVVVVDVTYRFFMQNIFNYPRAGSKIAAIYKFVSCKEPANIVFLGASKANHHYNSQQVEDSLCIKAYNYGWDGCSIIHQYLSLLRAIKNGGLKVVILDISTAQIGNEWVKERISDYWPYYWENDTIKIIVDEIEGKNMSVILSSSLIQYNSQIFNSFMNVKQNKGFAPLPYTGKIIQPLNSKCSPEEEIYTLREATHPIAIKYLKRMRDICEEKGIKLVVCLSPTLENSLGQEQYLQNICYECGIEWWNMSSDISEGIFFSNETHLNEKGAKAFTEHIIERLHQYF